MRPFLASIVFDTTRAARGRWPAISVEIQQAAYRLEADLIGLDGIPQLTETEDQVQALSQMHWVGAFVDDLPVGITAWEQDTLAQSEMTGATNALAGARQAARGPTEAHIFVLRCPSVEVHRSASKHGVSDDDVLHAVEHEMVSFDLEPDADRSEVLVIRPDSAGNLLEVIVLVLADDRMIAIHAMKLRRHFYELLPGEEGSP